MKDLARFGCVVLLFGCADVLLDPGSPHTLPSSSQSERSTTPDPTRGPTELAAPACALVSDRQIDFGDHIRPGMVSKRSVRVTGCDARDLTLTYLTAEGEGFEQFGDVFDPVIRAGTQEAVEVEVEFRPLVSGRAYAGTLFIHTDDPMRPRIEVALSGRGGWSTEACAPWTALINGMRQPGLAAPDDRLVLQADPPAGRDAKGARVRWTVIDRPADSTSQPVEYFNDPVDARLGGAVDDADTATARFAVDAPGKYLFEAEITPSPATACPPQAVRIGVEACPCPGDLQVQVVWDVVEGAAPPGPGTPTDLDLVLMHPAGDAWDHIALACSASQPTQPWDDPADIADDPRLDADASHAPGVENVFLDRVARRDGLYRVGVLQRRPFEWSATASVRVFLGDRMVWQATDRALRDGDAFWDVAGVGWFEDRLVVLPIDRVYQTGGAYPDPADPLRPGAPCLPDRSPRCSDELACTIEPGADHGSCRTEGL